MFANTSPPTIITFINIHQYTVQLVIFWLFYYWYLAKAAQIRDQTLYFRPLGWPFGHNIDTSVTRESREWHRCNRERVVLAQHRQCLGSIYHLLNLHPSPTFSRHCSLYRLCCRPTMHPRKTICWHNKTVRSVSTIKTTNLPRVDSATFSDIWNNSFAFSVTLVLHCFVCTLSQTRATKCYYLLAIVSPQTLAGYCSLLLTLTLCTVDEIPHLSSSLYIYCGCAAGKGQRENFLTVLDRWEASAWATNSSGGSLSRGGSKLTNISSASSHDYTEEKVCYCPA